MGRVFPTRGRTAIMVARVCQAWQCTWPGHGAAMSLPPMPPPHLDPALAVPCQAVLASAVAPPVRSSVTTTSWPQPPLSLHLRPPCHGHCPSSLNRPATTPLLPLSQKPPPPCRRHHPSNPPPPPAPPATSPTKLMFFYFLFF